MKISPFKSPFKIGPVLALILSLLLFSSTLSSLGQAIEKSPSPPKNLPKLFDADKNKVFDHLDGKLAPASGEDTFPVIVTFTSPQSDEDYESLQRQIGPFKAKYRYDSLPAMATTLTKSQIEALSRMDKVKQIEYDMPVQAFLDTATYWFGVQKARTDFGVTGDRDGNAKEYSKDDIVIAVIDTGIDTSHPDLDGGKVIGWRDFIKGKTTPYDDNGHGTYCSSIAAGEGDKNSAYKGVAPGAALVGVKALDNQVRGTISDVNAGIDWVIKNKDTYGIEIMNLSLGAAGSSGGTDSTSLLCNTAVDNGIVVCVAAGNEGPTTYTIGSPAAAKKPITVGSMSDCGESGFFLSGFSSRGPTADGRIKPDVCAPGHNVTAAWIRPSGSYSEKSGTSASTPFIAGTAALMLSANPTLTPLEIKTKIMETAWDWGPTGADIDYGAGRLDSYKAVQNAGSYTGINLALPQHKHLTGFLTRTWDSNTFDLNVVNTDYPIAITLIMPNWASITNPDFDLYLYNPAGTEVARSWGTTRQETIGHTPVATGTYRIKVYSYIGSGSYFLDASTATPAWSYSTGATALSPPSVDPSSGYTYVGTNNGVDGLSTAEGLQKPGFPFTIGAAVQNRPPVGWVNGISTIYAGADNGYLYAINAGNGSLLWSKQITTTGAIQGSVAVQFNVTVNGAIHDTLFVGTCNTDATSNKVCALDMENGGNVLWTFQPGNMDVVKTTPSADWANNLVYITSKAGATGIQPSLWAIHTSGPSAGTLAWSKSLGDITSSPAIDMWSGGGYVYVASDAGYLYKFDRDGNQKWSFHLDSATEGFPWPHGGKVYVSTASNGIYRLTDGATVATLDWNISTAVIPYPSYPLIYPEEGVLYVGSSHGKLYKIKLSDGAIVDDYYLASTTDTIGSPIADNQRAYIMVGTTDLKIHAIAAPY